MNAKLIIAANHEPEAREIAFDRPQITIGRKPGNELHFNRPEVSGVHASFSMDGEEYFISDLGSTNGTLLNGAQLIAHERYSLQHKDVITIGPYRILFEFEADTASETLLEVNGSVKGGTLVDVSQRVATGTEEHKKIDRQTAAQVAEQAGNMTGTATVDSQNPPPAEPPPPPPQPAAQPEPAPIPPPPINPPRLSPAPQTQEEPDEPVVVPAKGVDYVWLALGALFLLCALGLIAFLLIVV